MQRFLYSKLTKLGSLLVLAIGLGVVLPIIGRSNQTNSSAECLKWFPAPSKMQFATGFAISYRSPYKLVTVGNSKIRSGLFYYILGPQKTPGNPQKILPVACRGLTRINTPVRRVVALSTTHLAAIEELGQGQSVIGFSNVRLITSPNYQKAVAAKKVSDVYYPPNPERVLALKPDLVMAYIAQSARVEGVEALWRQNLPVVVNYDFRERSALARAEWIKFVAAFYDLEKEAAQHFSMIVDQYQILAAKVKKIVDNKKPVILLGSNQHGVWVAPGVSSDLVQLVNDAGGRYLFLDMTKDSSRISLRYEQVVSKMSEASIWLPHNGWLNWGDIIQEDRRYQTVGAIKQMVIYNNNRQLNPYGGNNYWEMAVMRPDLLLKDLVKIFHPGLLLKHNLRWYHLLEMAK
jgi:iron complex transport system substrate-binding protein